MKVFGHRHKIPCPPIHLSKLFISLVVVKDVVFLFSVFCVSCGLRSLSSLIFSVLTGISEHCEYFSHYLVCIFLVFQRQIPTFLKIILAWSACCIKSTAFSTNVYHSFCIPLMKYIFVVLPRPFSVSVSDLS